MSLPAISQALETRLSAMSPALATAWENVTFTPTAGTPYQRANLLPATPNDYALGQGSQEIGILQVSVCYPLNKGRGDALARAEAIRAAFPKNLKLPVSGPMAVKIIRTPAIAAGFVDGDRWVIPVTIRWSDR